ncbi:uncharacterized protein Triagg1_7699 [Trichoderma aggressivum f. europaeum]|uniref:Methyltransferase domain-containing protein n=1 Tax=Trichoderma aggressivum f. europaeum TaxID=173218 RepID=A0AAE1J1U4_9HYPO|nr:hypothetical protein Triagg1_7699 [Trichoderma aggressivum f. europaeum]
MQRLNQQHDLLVRLCHGNLIHPDIPQPQISRVADIGTGTGCWLQDAVSVLAQTTADASMVSIGVDISNAHFPLDKHSNIEFITHDILQPFPEEFHGRFDLVHVRLLVLALKREEIPTAAKNAAILLKKGGYLQWEEIEPSRLAFSHATPAITSVRAAMRANSIANGLASTPSRDITAALEELSFGIIKVEDYSSEGRDEFTIAAKEWTKAGAKAVLHRALRRSEGASGDATKADELLGDYVRDIDGGVVPTIPFVMVLGQKV